MLIMSWQTAKTEQLIADEIMMNYGSNYKDLGTIYFLLFQISVVKRLIYNIYILIRL